MDSLPSYSEATTTPDWLALVAPCVPSRSWPACCLVDRRFYQHFAPLLWQDPLVVIRQLGLHPNDDLTWYRRFILKHIKNAHHGTRCMVRSLDFRHFALRASGLYSTEASERAISESFKSLPRLFPNLVCLLLDGHPELDPGSLALQDLPSQHSLELLDLARCRQELSSKIFSSSFFANLIYLDVSYVPGSLKSAMHSSLNPQTLPALRVLKAQGREVDDSTAALLCQTFRLQLWSLDLSNNKLTDRIVSELVDNCLSSLSFRSDAHFEREGKLTLPRSVGSRKYGPFEFIEESAFSSVFKHPERYLADAPHYSRRSDQAELQEWQVVRSDGLGPLKSDDSGGFKVLLLGETVSAGTSTLRLDTAHSLRPPKGGLTHLYLSGNKFTSRGVEKLFRLSLGRFEHFECDSCLFPPPPVQQNAGVRIIGLFGAAHLFRPVVSSNLRSLRVHHSLVTQVPAVTVEGVSLATAARLAEGALFKNVRRAYPQAFAPDTNPRIVSLTLMSIPARSTGPVIEQLCRFLDLASAQQKAVKDTSRVYQGRGPSTLTGLRHIRLELEPSFTEDSIDSSTGRDIDYDKLLDPANEDFGTGQSKLLDDEWGLTSRGKHSHRDRQNGHQSRGNSTSERGFFHWTSNRLKSYPYSDTETEYLMHQPDLLESWTGNIYSIPVWIGPGTIGPSAAVNEYMWNVQDANLRTDAGPATPAHVAAGVPPSSYIFYAAWDAIVFPKNTPVVIRDPGVPPFQDVAAAIKEYRLRTRGTPDHWGGRLELVRSTQASRYHSSEYWR
ncbi:hypothetical protein F4780DRAFT_768497 [Xylariomycetidae sp. FL0641]|nr:hypothetical protein F4780DRAFT_768497 [Xylariomycetidae sp. FL0641]